MTSAETSVVPSLPRMETARLLLREFRSMDVHDVFAYAGDPQVTRFVRFETHPDLDTSRRYIEAIPRQVQENQRWTWAMQLKPDGPVIGSIGFHHISLDDRRAEIGFVIARTYWKHGFTPEAVTCMLDYAFRVRALNRVEAFCNPENEASQRVLAKCGFLYEGLLRQREFTKGSICDLKIFSILRQDVLGSAPSSS